MIVTLNEIQKACQKALAGCGFPAGLDDEAGEAAAWLEARGLPGLEPVVEGLDRWSQDPASAHHLETHREGGLRLFLGRGRSAVFLAPFIIDLASCDLQAVGGEARCRITTLRDPQVLLPSLQPLRQRGISARLEWQLTEGSAIAVGSISSAGGFRLFGDWAGARSAEAEVTVLLRNDGRPAGDQGEAEALPGFADESELKALAARNLASGLTVDDGLWSRLAVYAHRALVPASAESRARGAGVVGSDKD